jgi:hypothetical protein
MPEMQAGGFLNFFSCNRTSTCITQIFTFAQTDTYVGDVIKKFWLILKIDKYSQRKVMHYFIGYKKDKLKTKDLRFK